MIRTKQRALAEEQSFDFHEFDSQVADYLRSSPDFFSRNPQLLMEIDVPHYERGAVSLVEKRMALHRDQYEELRERLSEIVEVAHRSDYLAELLHEYSMSLMAADSMADIFTLTQQTLASKLQCEEVRSTIVHNDVVELCIQEPLPQQVAVADSGFIELITDLHTRKSVYCGHASAERIEQFFPQTTLDINSVAIIKLSHTVAGTTIDMGYLALASADKKRFAPHMATDFLQRFGALLSARLAVFYS